MRLAATIILILSASGLVLGESARPNVVIFYTDDQGTLDANCYGSTDLATPAIDELAQRGVRFTQAYAHAVCCPSRALLMTGRHPQRSGIINWTQGSRKPGEGNPTGTNLPKEEITIAESLRDAGYRTALFGKWHLGARDGHGPIDQGFETFYGHLGGFIDNYRHYFLHGRGFHDLYDQKQEVFEPGWYFPDLMTKRATDYIGDNHDSPFLMVVSFNIPHYPEQPDKRFIQQYDSLPMPRRSYAAMVSTVDDRIGRVVSALEEHNIRDNTIIVYMSDNGHSAENKGPIDIDTHRSGFPKGHYYSAHGGGGNTGKWIGQKGSFLEGGIRVPAIMSYPNGIPEGVVRDQAITAADWMPTILSLCNVDLPKRVLDGRDLKNVLASDSAESPHKHLHWGWANQWAVRVGPWKLLGSKSSPKQLVNLSDEQPERKNYLDEHPERVKTMFQLHQQWLNSTRP